MFNRKLVITAIVVSAAAASAFIPQSHAASSSNAVQFPLNKLSYTDSTGQHHLPVAPYIQNGNAMVPLRALSESLGAEIRWDPEARSVSLTSRHSGTAVIKPGENEVVFKDGRAIRLTEKAEIVQGILFVPARGAASILGAEVSWDGAKRTVTVAMPDDSENELRFEYGFDKDNEGWNGDFADLPVNFEESIYELKHGRELLPTEGNKSDYGLLLAGMNRSDDLFMFLSKKIEGFEPNASYEAELRFGMYTSEAGGMMGVGGSPAESVFVKAGMTSVEPVKIEEDKGGAETYYRMNIDKGVQSSDGADAKIVGNVAKPDTAPEGFARVDFVYNATVKANAKGEIFLLIGTDSGYEGRTTLYFDDITFTAKKNQP